MLKTLGNSALNVAKSKTAKSIAKTIGRQALNSSLNATKEVLRGNSLKETIKRSASDLGVDIIDEIQHPRKKPNAKKPNAKKPKIKKASHKVMNKYSGKVSRPY